MRIGRSVSVIAGILAGAVFSAAAVSAQSVDVPVDGGDAKLLDASGEELAEGQGVTTFQLGLVPGSSCPGDSRNDQWRVMTFIVPADVEPGALTYDSIGPEGEGFYALYGLDTNPIVEVLTASNDAPGSPGLILGLPPASFEIFPPGTLPDGRYRVGVACTYFDRTAIYWDAEIQVARDPEDQPAEISWRVVSVGSTQEPVGSDAGAESGSSPTAPVVAAVGAAVVLVVILGARSRRHPIAQKERS